ncbi:MAG: nitrilase-related carbon-nitrogen hydrolase, partial [Paracoccaceae bacterium]
MRAALIQLCSGDEPRANLTITSQLVREAARGGASFVLTPEVTNCVSRSRKHQTAVLSREAEDITLAALRELAAELNIWLLIGSLALSTGDADGRFVNRSFMVSPTGKIVARYDKIHMFDVAIGGDESFAESSAYRPGDRAVLAQTGGGRIGLT